MKKNKHILKNNRKIDGAFTANNFYLYENLNEDDEFKIIASLPIEGNEILIDEYLNEIVYGSNESRKDIDNFVKEIKRRREQHLGSNVAASEGRDSDRRYDSLDIRQQSNRRGDNAKSGSDEDIRYRLVDDQAEIERLESEPTIKAYRAMQVINGELYPPMSAVVDGKLRNPIALGQWEQSEERPVTVDMLSAVIE